VGRRFGILLLPMAHWVVFKKGSTYMAAKGCPARAARLRVHRMSLFIGLCNRGAQAFIAQPVRPDTAPHYNLMIRNRSYSWPMKPSF